MITLSHNKSAIIAKTIMKKFNKSKIMLLEFLGKQEIVVTGKESGIIFGRKNVLLITMPEHYNCKCIQIGRTR